MVKGNARAASLAFAPLRDCPFVQSSEGCRLLAGSCPCLAQAEDRLTIALPTLGPAAPSAPNGSKAHVRTSQLLVVKLPFNTDAGEQPVAPARDRPRSGFDGGCWRRISDKAFLTPELALQSSD